MCRIKVCIPIIPFGSFYADNMVCKQKIAKDDQLNLNNTVEQWKSELSWANFYRLWFSLSLSDIRVRQNIPRKESTVYWVWTLRSFSFAAYLLIFSNNISFSIKSYSTKHSCPYRGKQGENPSMCLLYNNWHSSYQAARKQPSIRTMWKCNKDGSGLQRLYACLTWYPECIPMANDCISIWW